MVEICNGSGVPDLSHNNYLVIYMNINGTILVTSNLKQTKIGPHFRKQLLHTLLSRNILMSSLHNKLKHVCTKQILKDF